MLFLIIIFLVVNAIFLEQYIFDDSSVKKKQKKDVYGYLKKYVDFNSTTFEKESMVYFHFPKYDGQVVKRGNYSDEDYSTYYIDKDVIVDAGLRVCKTDVFDIKTMLCGGNATELVDRTLCDMNVKCCSTGFKCFLNCRKFNNYSYCNDRCKLNLLNNDLYCYYNTEEITNWDIKTYQT
jgi:hypothetical protein